MISLLSDLPLYVWVNICLLLGATFICILLWCIGAGIQTLGRLHTVTRLPRISRFAGSGFPTPVDEIYTLLFILFYAYACLSSAAPSTPKEPGTLETWYTNIVHTLIYMPFALRYMSLPPADPIRKRCILWVFLGLICIYTICGIMGACGLEKWLMQLTDTPAKQEVTEMMANETEPSTLIALCFGSIVIAPIMEEFAFRGFLYNVLRQRAGIFAASLASSLLFAAIHMALVQALPLFVFAIVQCILYEKTGSLRYCILLHMLFNSISTVAILTTSA